MYFWFWMVLPKKAHPFTLCACALAPTRSGRQRVSPRAPSANAMVTYCISLAILLYTKWNQVSFINMFIFLCSNSLLKLTLKAFNARRGGDQVAPIPVMYVRNNPPHRRLIIWSVGSFSHSEPCGSLMLALSCLWSPEQSIRIFWMQIQIVIFRCLQRTGSKLPAGARHSAGIQALPIKWCCAPTQPTHISPTV